MVLFMARFRSVYASDKYQCPCFSGTADDVYEPDSEAIWGAGARRRCGAEFVQGSATQKAPQGEDKKIRYQTGVGKITCQDEGCSAHQSKSVANRGPLILGTGYYYVCKNGNPAHIICEHSYYLTKQHQDTLRILTAAQRKKANDYYASATPTPYQENPAWSLRETLRTDIELFGMTQYQLSELGTLEFQHDPYWLNQGGGSDLTGKDFGAPSTKWFETPNSQENDSENGEGPVNVRRRLNVSHDTRRRPNVTERNLSHLLEKK